MSPAERRAENHTEGVQERFAEYNVLATFPDMEAAREAITALERAGIDAARTSLLSREHGENVSAESVPTDVEQRQVDLDMTSDVGKRAGAGAGIGGVAGAALGAAAFAIPGIGPVVGAGILGAALGGGAFGGAVGGLLGAFSGQPAGQEWQSTYESVKQGEVAVAAHSDDRGEFEKAAEVLRGLEPTNIVEFDADGERLDPA